MAAVSLTGIAAHAQSNEKPGGKIKHVLLLSVDGMHAIDFKNCAEGLPTVDGGGSYCPNLAGLTKNAVNYVAASTSPAFGFLPRPDGHRLRRHSAHHGRLLRRRL